MGSGATPRSRTYRLQSGRRFSKKAASASCMSAEHSREAHTSFSTRIACSMVRFRVTDAMALFCSESTFAQAHVATACIRGSCAGYTPTPVLRSMGSVPLRSMLGQFLCQASRKAPLLRKVLREKGHRSHGSMEGRLRVNGAVLIGCQVSAHAHAPRRLPRCHPCLPGPDNPELFHAKGQRRTVQAQAHCRPLRACEHPLGLLQRRQDQRPVVLFQRLGLSTLVAWDDRGT